MLQALLSQFGTQGQNSRPLHFVEPALVQMDKIVARTFLFIFNQNEQPARINVCPFDLEFVRQISKCLS